MDTANDNTAAADPWAIDEMLDRYISWREECGAVRLAYRHWVDADRREQGLAYAGYLTALDGEERAARAYASQVDRVSRNASPPSI